MKSKMTIADVAKAAGVSSSAVSYALNGKPGVSEKTRDKVLQVAEQMGWKPNSAAKALSDASTHSIGLILTYDTDVLSVESYTMELIAGLTAVFEAQGYSLLLRSSSNRQHEVSIMKEWIATGAVDALLMLNVELSDPRVALLKQYPKFPVLMLCSVEMSDGMTALSDNEKGAAHLIVDYCYELGHRHIARVAGPEMMGHTFVRVNAFLDETSELNLRYNCLHTDYSPAAGRRSVERLLSLPNPPTAIVCDNDVMALAAIRTARRLGFKVPEDLSIISWDDSFMCEINEPSVTALNRNVVGRGKRAARMLIDMAEGRPVDSYVEDDYELIFRDSSGPVDPKE